MVKEKGCSKCAVLWAGNFWIISHSQEHLEQKLKDLIKDET